MLNYLTVNTTIEIVCLLIAFICLLKDDSQIWQGFILYLFVTCVAEILGIYIKKQLHQSNAWVYNMSMIFEAIFVSLMYWILFGRYNKSKPIIAGGLILLGVIYIYDIMSHGLFDYNNLTYSVMSILYVFYAMFYYYSLLQDDEYIHLKYSAKFWWVTGTLFFYFGSTVCNLFYNSLLIVITPRHYLTYYIYNALNIILYGCWSYSFICKKWLMTTSEV